MEKCRHTYPTPHIASLVFFRLRALDFFSLMNPIGVDTNFFKTFDQRNIISQRLAMRRCIKRSQAVLQTELDRIDSKPFSQFIDCLLDTGCYLGITKSAEGSGVPIICVSDIGIDMAGFILIWSHGMNSTPPGHKRSNS